MAQKPLVPVPPLPAPGASQTFCILKIFHHFLSAALDDWIVDVDMCEAFNKAQVAGRCRKWLYNQQLASEPNWKYRIGKGWKGKRVLGPGGQGIVDHWTYEGLDMDQKTVMDIAKSEGEAVTGSAINL